MLDIGRQQSCPSPSAVAEGFWLSESIGIDSPEGLRRWREPTLDQLLREEQRAAAQRMQCTLVASPQLPSHDDRQPQGKEPKLSDLGVTRRNPDIVRNSKGSLGRHFRPEAPGSPYREAMDPSAREPCVLVHSPVP